jgi:hypothetical protein
MWRGMGFECLRHARLTQVNTSSGSVESSGAALMTPLRCGQRGYITERWMAWAYCAPGVSFQAVSDKVLDL